MAGSRKAAPMLISPEVWPEWNANGDLLNGFSWLSARPNRSPAPKAPPPTGPFRAC